MAEQIPLNLLRRAGLNPATAFTEGARNIRSLLSTPEAQGGTVLAPLRGAMPILWAAEGDKSAEPDVLSTLAVEAMPLGVFNYIPLLGNEIATTSPSESQKAGIIKRCIGNLSLDPNFFIRRVYLLDEVQKGGTLGVAAPLTKAALTEYEYSQTLRVIAAQDTKGRVAAQPKTKSYANLASNSVEGVKAYVIPTALIATDIDGLLDTVTLGDSPTNPRQKVDSFLEKVKVIHNVKSERLIRSLGTLSRLPQVRHDDSYVWEMLNNQCRDMSEPDSSRSERWVEALINRLDEQQQEKSS